MIPLWQANASRRTLKARAKLYADIRQFFAERGVLEVDTPIAVQETATEPHLHSIQVISNAAEVRYLHTSPEFAMKRLLADGSGSIYQICKVFRGQESGQHHQPEFTMLEWYRLGYSHRELMDEVEMLLKRLASYPRFARTRYADAFLNYTDLDPHTVSIADLQAQARQLPLSLPQLAEDDRAGWMDLLFSHLVAPNLGVKKPEFLYDYPQDQAALARIRQEAVPVAERFELFIGGLEIANGFHELKDAAEQRHRFENELRQRRQMALEEPPCPEKLLAALDHGLPDCAGVALGLDRLLMLLLKEESIANVLSFDWMRI